MITKELVCSLIDYRDGELFWKVRKSGRKTKKEAGTVDSQGYRQICIDYKLYRAHRLVYLMFNGFVPEFLDHIDGNPSNNKIENLREATQQENQRNKGPQLRNKTGVKNVSKRKNKYRVGFTFEGKHIHGGYYDTIEEAAEVAKIKRQQLHKEFARHE
jgi:hypothetical protein